MEPRELIIVRSREFNSIKIVEYVRVCTYIWVGWAENPQSGASYSTVDRIFPRRDRTYSANFVGLINEKT